ncbi:helix-turn-helix domain-containing protein [Aliarcobacter butzleri]|uniref:Helix-turn-helix domain-containing protein n=1 Tax=Aliarcobacter butzleri TaxID=28197 RepID=A0AAW7PQY2_9BACT|nr:helix-turn-helix domain-containing protein [Aliarcobacter butzleri]MCG3661182.1 helix-turn-helix domain containing protein [Aliarcobacter butzleri]MCG3678407.1 helix-turn-helix domain containing protein [Aliarcobacter butzleri]MDN5063753.1 helix-turn-helix domain-containing protein [Aliarcobacter butzleri]MDN5064987.1 helix-turn-helix domain-containing protein [Aliarcobacter butzleri]
MNNVEIALKKLCSFYNARNASELSKKMNISEKTISNWKIRNSISAIKKKCIELNIYPQIFGNTEVYNEHIYSEKRTSEDYLNFDYYFTKLLDYFHAPTIKELAEKINIPANTISKWNQRKSIPALKKVSRELEIYREIFKDEISKSEAFVLQALKQEEENERKNSIDEDTMFHIQNLFTIAKKKDLLKELKTELSMMYLKYSTYDKDSKTENGKNIFSDKIVFSSSNESLNKDYENWDEKKALDYEVNRQKNNK